MLYGVFGNVVTIVEEFEKREHGNHEQLPQSNIYIPDQSRKDNEEVRLAFALLCRRSDWLTQNLRFKTIRFLP